MKKNPLKLAVQPTPETLCKAILIIRQSQPLKSILRHSNPLHTQILFKVHFNIIPQSAL